MLLHTLFFLQKGKHGAVCACVCHTSHGNFLIIPIGIETFRTIKQYNNLTIRTLLTVLSPLLGFGIYALYLWFQATTIFSQPAFEPIDQRALFSSSIIVIFESSSFYSRLSYFVAWFFFSLLVYYYLYGGRQIVY